MMALGPAIGSKEAYELGIFTGLFSDFADAEKQIATFAKLYSTQGQHRLAMHTLKTRMFQ